MDQRYSYLILILCLLSCFVALIHADLPVITQELRNEKVKEGSMIIFICKASGATSFAWFKNSKKASSDRYEVTDLDNGSLFRIYRIRKPRDEAEFKCVASNDDGSVETKGLLTIYAENSLPSGFPKITVSPELRVIELGRQATMDCSASGNPNPTIYWLKDDKPLDLSDSRIRVTNETGFTASLTANVSNNISVTIGQMQIDHSTNEDEGNYECYARNSAGTLFSEEATLFVRERQNPPRFSIYPEDQEIAPGQDVELTCVAVGAPMPMVHWMKDNVDINDETQGRNVLMLKDVRVSSNYTCRASSSLGVIYAVARVTVRAPPKAPSAPVANLPAPAESVTLNWTPSSQEAVSSYVLLYKLVSSTGPYSEITDITGTTTTVENLLPFTSYEFMIKGVNTIGIGEASPPVTVKTGELAPGSPPIRVKVSLISSSSILVQWDAPEVPNGRITGYKIYYTAKPSSDLSVWETSTVDDIQLTSISQLTPLKLYSVKVAARTEIGYGPTSPVMKIKVQQGIPSQPMNFEATSISESKIQLTWEEPTDYTQGSRIVINYEIFYNSTSRGEEHTTISPGQGQYILSNLSPYTVYNIRLAARSDTGLGPSTRVVSVRTQQAVPGEPPRDVQALAVSATEIRVTWNPPSASLQNGVITGYTLSYRKAEGVGETKKSVRLNNTSRSHNLTGLGKWTSYEISLSARTIIGNGPETDPAIRVRTMEAVPGAPRKVTVEALNSTAIRVSWGPPREEEMNGVIHGYQIHYYQMDENTNERVYDYSKDFMYPERTNNTKLVEIQSNNPIYLKKDQEQQVVNITELQPNTIYEVEIAAYTSMGDGERTKAKSVRTLGAVPSKPQNFVMDDSDGRYLVTWDPPLTTFGPIEGYTLEYKPDGGRMVKLNIQSTQNSHELQNLYNGITYAISIQANNAAGGGQKATIEYTLPEAAPYSPPSNISAVVINSTSIKLTWDQPVAMDRNGIITGYTVHSSQAASSRWGPGLETTNKFIIYTNLQPNTMYAFEVRAHTAVGSGPYSHEIRETTDPKGLMQPPTSVTATVINGNSIRVEWEPPASQSTTIDGYRVYYARGAKMNLPLEDWNVKATVPRPTWVMLQDLEESDLYTIVVQAQSRYGDSPPSQEVSLRTTTVDPRAPQNFVVTRTGSDFAELEWERPPRGNPIEYKLVFFNPDNEDAGKKIIVDGTENVFLVSLLFPDLDYTFTLTPSFDDGPGSKVWTYTRTDEAVNTSRQGTTAATSTLVKTIEAPKSPQVTSYKDKPVVRITIPIPSDTTSPVVFFYVIVVQLKSDNAPTGDPDSLGFYKELTMQRRSVHPRLRRQAGTEGRYIAAKLSSDEINKEFMIGDGQKYDNYVNKPLVLNNYYTFFIQYATKSDNGYGWVFSTFSDTLQAGVQRTSETAQPAPDQQPPMMVIIAGAAGLVVLIVIIIILVFVCRKRSPPEMNDPKPCKRKEETALYPRDPVEMRRLNFQTPGMMSHPPIPIGDLAEHIEVLKLNENLKFSQEYESIEPGQSFTWDHSNMEYNKQKNRYANVIAYDHSRVILGSIEGYPGSDYINANFCDGYCKTNAYMSTQGPLPETIPDFWRMIWEHRTSTIVMMTRLEERSRVKCDQYWPMRGSETYGSIQVTLLDSSELAHYIIRTFSIINVKNRTTEKREVRQFQFTAWPDHGVPEHATGVLQFVNRVKNSNPNDAGPIAVHCSAGVGRTGAFIVIDSMLERIKHEKSVDIYGHVTCLRAQRNYMVQTEEQYIFIHDALLEAVTSGNTEIPARNLYMHLQKMTQPDAGETVTGMELEFKRLANQKALPSKFISANLPANKFKNRLVNILPYENTRVCLQPIRGVEGSDYINASYIDGYRAKNAYIATQGPLAETTEDFWRMLWEHNSTIIVMLTKLKEMGREKCHQYWPAERSARYQYFVVDPMSEYNMPQYILREFKVTDARDGQSRTIRQFQFVDWPEQGVPKSGEGFIDFIGQVHKTKEQFGQDGPISIHCSAGVGRTGVFVTLSIILERMRYEGVVDMFQTVKMLRTQRPAMVQTEDQYQFCYRAALEYLGSFDHYAN
ncbi:tyrosine-protein phosphatase Lar-like isoform X3 [Anneissia japonica]|uniref:tyrosine-protein phosphatase Lar-like isoform X3 n=1 Tax=Anneissia japonica TaxID=1529436 RepID=UPI0014257E3A|nr:tyrosine-protein phosphatase Lar-like isoform X3 [Anneissia japonica]